MVTMSRSRSGTRRRGVLASSAFVLCTVLLGCGSGAEGRPSPSPSPSAGTDAGERVTVGGFDALVWGTGEYGVVLVHGAAFDAASWERQAAQIADAGMAVLAVEDTSEDSLIAAVDFLISDRGAREVALLGASAGGAAVIDAASSNPDAYDQLVLLSPAGGAVQELSEGRKLFIYSRDEGAADAIEELIADTPGSDNVVLEIDGTAHAQAIFETSAGADVMAAILSRLADS